MQIVDFEYDGILLSSFNLIVCDFSGGGGFNTVSLGNKITMNKIKAANSNKNKSIGYKYDSVYSTTFQVGKFGCYSEDNVISEMELNDIMRWLNRKMYAKFKVVYEDGSFSEVFYNGIFNVEAIKYGDEVIGLQLSFETDSPCAYMDEVTFEQVVNINSPLILDDVSNETGYIYPNVKIEFLETGDLVINNEFDTNPVVIKNGTKGEVVSINGDTKVVSTSFPTHSTLPNDFNYNYLRVVNSYENVRNIFTTDLSCKLTITYSPIIKAGIVL